MDFSPEITNTPNNLNAIQLLSQLPDAYLADPNASNYVALGVVYCLMGLGTPEDPGYVDRVLSGVFTALNDKAAHLGLPAFDPPSTLDPLASTRTAASIDRYLMHQADIATNPELDQLKQVMRLIFPHPHIAASGTPLLTQHANDAIDFLVNTKGYKFQPSTTNENGAGTYNYDSILYNAVESVGNSLRIFPRGVPQDIIQEGIDYIVEKRLQPTSSFIKSVDPNIGNFGGYLSSVAQDFARNFYKKNKHLFREQSTSRLNDDGEDVTDEPQDPDNRHTDAETILDIRRCLTDFRDFIETNGKRVHGDAKSLVKIFDLLLAGHRQIDIRKIMGYNDSTGPYRERFKALRELGEAFANKPEYASFIRSIFG